MIGYRVFKSPLTDQILSLYGNYTGIAKSLGANSNELPSCTYSDISIEECNLNAIMHTKHKINLRPASLDKTIEKAILKGFSELAERYCLFMYPFAYPDILTKGTYKGIAQNGIPLSLSYVNLWDNSNNKFKNYWAEGVISSLKSDDEIMWIEGESITKNIKVYIPAQIIFLSTSSLFNEKLYWLGTSSGTASHTNRNEAIISSVLELVERDSIMKYFYTNITPIEVSPFGESKKLLNEIGESRLFRFYFLPNEFKIPVFVTVSLSRDKKKPYAVFGSGSGLNPDSALKKSLMESLQGISLVTYYTIVNDIKNNKKFLDLDSGPVLYGDPKNSDFLEQYLTSTSLDFESVFEYNEYSLYGLENILERVKKNDYDLFLFDITTEDIKEVGLTVIRAYIPQLIPFSVPALPPVSHPKFDDVKNITPFVHPFP
ncbi:MAG: YcaO-like family protein [Thermoplasmata archaeon]